MLPLAFVFVILHCAFIQISGFTNSIFYCGFSEKFCGQSYNDDVNSDVNTVILAFANIAENGTIIFDQNHYSSSLTQKWQRNGKNVLISVGGQNGYWPAIYKSSQNTNNFINSLTQCVKKYRLDGVDLAIQYYSVSPRTTANMIINLKKKLNTLGTRLLVVSPEDVTIYQGVGVPGPDSVGQPWNYFVPIAQLADDYIDYYQPHAFNNWYDGFPGGSLPYYEDVYLNWRNYQGYSPIGHPIPNFDGIKGSKLRIGILASRQAGIPDYYGQPEVIAQFKDFIRSNSHQLNGFMIWDSNWDSRNQYLISKECQK